MIDETERYRRAEEARIASLSPWAYGRELRDRLIHLGLTERPCWRCQAAELLDAWRMPATTAVRVRRMIVRLVSGLGLRRKHPAQHWHDMGVCVDRELLPFLDYVNGNVTGTTMSCQGNTDARDDHAEWEGPWVATSIHGGSALANWLLDECGIFVWMGDLARVRELEAQGRAGAVIEVVPAIQDHPASVVFRFAGLGVDDLCDAAESAQAREADDFAGRLEAVVARAANDRKTDNEE